MPLPYGTPPDAGKHRIALPYIPEKLLFKRRGDGGIGVAIVLDELQSVASVDVHKVAEAEERGVAGFSIEEFEKRFAFARQKVVKSVCGGNDIEIAESFPACK